MTTMSERSEDIISSKMVVKENSQVNSSSRIYYNGGASVPFLWETRPGTPKHPLYSESFHLPPLTPPPSYYSSSSSSSSSSSENKLTKVRTKQTRFVKTLFNRKQHHVSRPSISWSSTTSSSSSCSSSSSPRSKTVHRANKCYLSCSRSNVKEDDEEEIGSSSSPTSTLCYKRGFSMKRALCSILSHKSSRNDLRLI